MKIDPHAQSHEATERTSSLADVLRQCDEVKVLVEDSARGLSEANAAIKQDLESGLSPLAGESALRITESVHVDVQAASELMTEVLSGLESEVRDRSMLDHQFAAAVEQERAARHASLHDVLTRMPNRALFNDRLEHGIMQARRHGWLLALMFVDLDHFKAINDGHGHAVGDGVLQTIARRLKDNTRSDDTVGRHGGDEFLYLATALHDELHICAIAEKIIAAIQAPIAVQVRGSEVSLSVKASVGISIFPTHGTDAHTLVKSADKAMYRAKQDGRGYRFAE